MLTSIASITLLAGLALVVVGLVGGGIEVKEIKIPTLPMVPRAGSFVIGCLLIGLVYLRPDLFSPLQPPAITPQPPTNAQPSTNAEPSPKRELGSAIPNLLEVRDVKRILQQLTYYNGPFTNEPDDAYFQAVLNFQHAKNIQQDGLVGAETYGKMREALPGFFGDKSQNH
jgi:peptidoglycan hydrolase-like protein with peptidoglycan-binding domain